MPSPQQIRQQITDQILSALKQGTPPWRRPWSSDANSGSPANAVSGRSYSGVNPLLLSIAAERFGFSSRWWGTYRQWQALGGQVQARPSSVPAGKWGTTIVFCKPLTKTKQRRDGSETEETFWSLRSFTVFNIEQVTGADVSRFRCGDVSGSPMDLDERFAAADEAVRATGADIRYGGDKAFYNHNADRIQMPERRHFESPALFHDTLNHELIHWSEHKSRLDWDRSKRENSYALGELIAEIGACYLAGELGLPIEQTIGNHAAYLRHWLEQMTADPSFIFQATSQASRAANYVLSFSRLNVEEDTEAIEESAASF